MEDDEEQDDDDDNWGTITDEDARFFEDTSSKAGLGSFATTTGDIRPVSKVGSEEGAEDLVNGSAAVMEEVFSEMTADSWEAGAADSFSSTL